MKKIKLKDTEFPILFSANVVEEIQNKFTDVNVLSEKISDMATIKWLLTLIINEGIAYENYMSGTNTPPVNEQIVGMLINLKDANNDIANVIVEAFNESLGGEKNLTAEQLTAIAREMTKSTSLG